MRFHSEFLAKFRLLFHFTLTRSTQLFIKSTFFRFGSFSYMSGSSLSLHDLIVSAEESKKTGSVPLTTLFWMSVCVLYLIGALLFIAGGMVIEISEVCLPWSFLLLFLLFLLLLLPYSPPCIHITSFSLNYIFLSAYLYLVTLPFLLFLRLHINSVSQYVFPQSSDGRWSVCTLAGWVRLLFCGVGGYARAGGEVIVGCKSSE